MPHPAGAIIVVSILVAAGIAAYENDNIRAWVERTRQKIAVGLNNIGDDFRPKRPIAMRSLQKDPSMREDTGDEAQARRDQIREQIAERARILEQKAKKKRQSTSSSQSPSFDSLVDDDGKLRSGAETPRSPVAGSTAIEAREWAGELRSRLQPVAEPVDDGSGARTLPVTQQNVADLEREMRNTFSIALPPRGAAFSSTHESASLLDLTPTTEDFPDPDYSVPSVNGDETLQRSEYFPPSRSSHTVSDAASSQYYYAHPTRPLVPLEPRSQTLSPAAVQYSVSSVPSVAGSTSVVHPSEAEVSEDDLLSEPDGIRTPASAWTEVGSSISGDDRLLQ
jgi:hypothetical protein